MRFALAFVCAALAAGCGSVNDHAATVAGGCGAFRPAPYAVQADTRQGQVWVNGTIETQHRVCGFPRPQGGRR